MRVLDVHESENERVTEDKKRKERQTTPVFPEEAMDLTSDLARPLHLAHTHTTFSLHTFIKHYILFSLTSLNTVLGI